jgi:hypothetical protein
MSAALIFALVAAPALAQNPKTYSDKDNGFSFSYPADWEFRKERLYSVIVIPLAENRKAEIQLVNTPFRGRAEAWQQAQADVAKSMNRAVDRQWEELLLNVPLLMTQLSYKEGEKAISSLVGLIYSRNAVKLSFRLTVPSEGYAEAEAKWRNTLNGLRTLSGSLPSVEDPTKAPTATSSTQTQPPRTTVLRPPATRVAARPGRGQKVETLNVLGQQLGLRIPRDWSVERAENGAFFLKHPRLTNPLRLDFGAGAEGDMRRAVVNAAGTFNTKLSLVDLRTEGAEKMNRSGASLYRIERRGRTTEGPLLIHAVGGHAGLLYWTTLLTGSDAKVFERETGLLKDLHHVLLLSPKE